MSKNKTASRFYINSANKTKSTVYEKFFSENKDPLTPLDIDDIINIKKIAISNIYNNNFKCLFDEGKSEYLKYIENQSKNNLFAKKNSHGKKILKKIHHKQQNFISLKNKKIKLGELCLYSFKGKDAIHPTNEIISKEHALVSSQNFNTIPAKDILS